MRSLRHLQYLLRHKWYVFRAGLRLKVPVWQLIIHDLSKFRPNEWVPYTNHFFPKPGSADWSNGREAITYAAFEMAQVRHFIRNPHHWQHWCEWDIVCGYIKPKPMPEYYIREMIADWEGAGRAKNGPGVVDWYASHKGDLVLHPETRLKVEELLASSN